MASSRADPAHYKAIRIITYVINMIIFIIITERPRSIPGSRYGEHKMLLQDESESCREAGTMSNRDSLQGIKPPNDRVYVSVQRESTLRIGQIHSGFTSSCSSLAIYKASSKW